METKLPLEKELEAIFLHKLPSFPETVKEFLAMYGPYLILISSILGVYGLFTAIGLGALLGINTYIGGGLGVLTLGLNLIAFTPLRARKKSGWNLLYYGMLIGLVGNIVQLSLIGAVVGGVVGFWVLFQIREKYS